MAKYKTIYISDEVSEDMKVVREMTGVSASQILDTLYRAWRDGKFRPSTLPKGDFDGPLRPGR